METELRVYESIDEIKQANRAIGHNFFSPDTLRFFSSRILEGVINGRFFITSERYNRNPSNPRMYTVRWVNNRGAVGNADNFQAHYTSRSARNHARELKASDYQ